MRRAGGRPAGAARGQSSRPIGRDPTERRGGAGKGSRGGNRYVGVKRTVALGALLAVTAVVAAVVLLTMHKDSSGKGAGSPATRPGAAAAASKLLQARSFAASYPATWSATSHAGVRGSALHQLSSTGAPVNVLGIAPAGTAGITITDLAASRAAIRKHLFSDPHLNAMGLMRLLVGTPHLATGVTLASAPRKVALGGVEAAEESYTYSWQGRPIAQVDVVARHAGRVVLMELDAEPSLASESQAALTLLSSSWHWA